ncbi:AbiTii domain-containing protein [Bordetella hinzii]|jgi:hypothetical protein|uniref:AbiTii domain-containing protein n=1 Tax=Bordetella hinzii TaxID=103855 RepID=UPI00138F447C
MASLIRDIQSKALDSTESVSSLLRLAKVAATKLDLSSELVWIENKLSSYRGLVSELPMPHRWTPRAHS